MDERIKKLAGQLVRYSVEAKEGDKVLLEYIGGDTEPLARAIIKEIYSVGAIPFVHFQEPRVQREILLGATEEQLEMMAKKDADEMSRMDCYIGIRGTANAAELSDVPAKKKELYARVYQTPVHLDIRVPKTRWVILRYPNPAMAQLANTSTESFENFYYDVCTLDYSKMEKAMQSLIGYMKKTDRVKIVGPGTDLSFSIKGIGAVECAGKRNIPDGEVYSAPVRDSVNGVITYNAPSIQNGFTFRDVCLTFKDGKIINATANDTERLNEVFDVDEGARYVGEFALGVNPYILSPMQDILFDEKISGSIHFTPGNCYDETSNGNHSSLHWDLVLIQREEYGGGRIYFDDVLIRENGRFVVDELKCLNPENLK